MLLCLKIAQGEIDSSPTAILRHKNSPSGYDFVRPLYEFILGLRSHDVRFVECGYKYRFFGEDAEVLLSSSCGKSLLLFTYLMVDGTDCGESSRHHDQHGSPAQNVQVPTMSFFFLLLLLVHTTTTMTIFQCPYLPATLSCRTAGQRRIQGRCSLPDRNRRTEGIRPLDAPFFVVLRRIDLAHEGDRQ